MGLDAKASFLCNAKLARNYADACSQLARRRKGARRHEQARDTVSKAVEGMWWKDKD